MNICKQGDGSRTYSSYDMKFELDKNKNNELILYRKKDLREEYKVSLLPSFFTGSICKITINDLKVSNYYYRLKSDNEFIKDKYARALFYNGDFGEYGDTYYEFVDDTAYNWKSDKKIKIAPNERLIYKLHLRGFLKGLGEQGLFEELGDYISYLKKFGVTTIELMPIIDFDEIDCELLMDGRERLNFWGYTSGHYLSPKRRYSSKNPVKELKDLIKKLHKNGFEMIIELYFESNEDPDFVLNVVKYWLNCYHFDGVHLNYDSYLDYGIIINKEINDKLLILNNRNYNNVYNYNDSLMNDIKSYLRGEDFSAMRLAYNITKLSMCEIGYAASHNGYTLLDSFSYKKRHNEANGFQNSDGATYISCTNCGIEGTTDDVVVNNKRKRLVMFSLFLNLISRKTPLIMSGDEMLNTQYGNNNPYCLDNEISWVNWNDDNEIRELIEKLMKFRKDYGQYYIGNEACMVSFHNDKAYNSPSFSYDRAFGIYYEARRRGNKALIYIGINGGDEVEKLALPAQLTSYLTIGESEISERTLVLHPLSCSILVGK